jgi:hypothetical protein
VIIRHAEPDDLTFVIKSWIDSYRASKSAGILSISRITRVCSCGQWHELDYKSVMEPTLDALIHRPNVRVLIAADPMLLPPRDLHGYIVVEDGVEVPVYRPPLFRLELEPCDVPVVHYVLVKRNHRQFGIASALFRAAGVDVTRHFYYSCTTPISVQIEKAMKKQGKPFGGEWNPSCARFVKGHHGNSASEGAPVQAPGADESAF